MQDPDPQLQELTQKIIDSNWQATHGARVKTRDDWAETLEITSSPEDMQAIAKAENEVVLDDFARGVMALAHELETWGEGPDVGLTHEVLLNRIQALTEKALQARASIRLKYKVTLL